MRVIFAGGGTGGHLYPGLAIARALVKLKPDAKPFFIGAKRGIERDVLPRSEFEYELLDLHPLYRSNPLLNTRTLRGAATAWRRIGEIVHQSPPACVVGTGGYASALMLGYAILRKIPYVIQEQNSYPGLTTRFFARFANQVHLGFPEASERLKPGAHTQLFSSGNPIEPPPNPLPDRMEARARWDIPADGKPVLLVFGGSQGSAAINDALAGWIRSGKGLDDLYVIWATGQGTYDKYAHLASERIKVLPYISPMAEAYAVSDLAVSRAGAMTAAELSAWGIPSIFIPLPTAAADHQTANAKALVDTKAGRLLRQQELNAESLASAVRGLVETQGLIQSMSQNALKRSRPDAAQDIAAQVLSLINSSDR